MQGLEYQLSKTEKLSSANLLQHVQLSAIVNSTAVNIVAKPDSGQILINISANGRSGTTRLDGHKLRRLPRRTSIPAPSKPCSPSPSPTTIATSGPSSPSRQDQFSPFNSPHMLISRARSTASQSPFITSSPPSLVLGHGSFLRPRKPAPPGRTSPGRLRPRPQRIRPETPSQTRRPTRATTHCHYAAPLRLDSTPHQCCATTRRRTTRHNPTPIADSPQKALSS